jgi:HAD superfamily hydrolase (TIGR01458 family)
MKVKSTPNSASGLLLDIDGVLHVGDQALPGAAETLEALGEAEIPLRFITNTSTRTPEALGGKLRDMGLPVADAAIFSAVSAARRHLERSGARRIWPVVGDGIRPVFADWAIDTATPDCVLIGDIGPSWDHKLLERIFAALMQGAELVALHRNRFWQTGNGLRLDIGAYVAALEATTGRAATVVGKPDAAFFNLAAGDFDCPPSEVVVVGDDVDSDIGGAQAAGMRGLLVQTGKYRADFVARSETTPDGVIASIAELPGWLSGASVT